jgi:hypothetical protein
VRHDLPTGTVTFLFTDVEGSTRLQPLPCKLRPTLAQTLEDRDASLLERALELARISGRA